MKKALLAVALMMAAITGWGKMSFWVSDEELSPNMQDWDGMGLIIFDGFHPLQAEEVAEIEAAIIAGGEEVNFNVSDFVGTSSIQHIGDVIFSKKYTKEQCYNDGENTIDKDYEENCTSRAIFYTYSNDNILKEFYFDSCNEYCEVNFTTWKSFGAVPEPASGLLIVMGSVLLAFRRKVA